MNRLVIRRTVASLAHKLPSRTTTQRLNNGVSTHFCPLGGYSSSGRVLLCQYSTVVTNTRVGDASLNNIHRRLTSSFSSSSSTETSSTLSANNGTRPFRVLGIQQVAIGCVERDPLQRLWIDVFGLQAEHTGITIESENVVEDILKVGSGETAVEIDLMTPIDPEKSPKVHVPPLNHIGLWIDDLETAVTWMTKQGVRMTPGGIRKGAAGHNVAFIHPKSNDAFPISGNGVLIELVQAPTSVIQYYSESTTTTKPRNET